MIREQYQKFSLFLQLIKFSHTIFALPFALISLLTATQGRPSLHMLIWVILAMVGARTGAMTFNRMVDLKFDQANPRTQNRPSARGEISVKAMIVYCFLAYGLLVLAAYQLNPLAFQLSPVAILLISFYSLTKRFTAYSHLFLGFAIGAAPVAAWIAAKGEISSSALFLGLSVMFWIAGFDVLYALQDLDFDHQQGLFSLPVKLGVAESLFVSKIFHLLTVLLWFIFYYTSGIHNWFLVGIVLSSLLLIWEHSLLSEKDLSQLNMAFFNVNGYISLTLFAFTVLSFW